MDTRVDQLCDDLRRKLNGIEQHVRDLKSKIERDREATIATIGEEIVVARAELKRAMDDAEAARVRMKAHLAEMKAAGEDQIEEWRRNREVEKLERWAEGAEAYAAWSLIVASKAIDEAELAAMQAIAARLEV
jgi:hypothetical protein